MRDDIRHFKLRLDKYGFLRGRDEEDQDLDFGDFVENEESIDTQQLDISSLGSGTTKPGTKNRSKPEKSTKSADADESSGSDNDKEPKKTKKASKKAYKIKSAEFVNSSEDESEQGDVLKDKPSTNGSDGDDEGTAKPERNRGPKASEGKGKGRATQEAGSVKPSKKREGNGSSNESDDTGNPKDKGKPKASKAKGKNKIDERSEENGQAQKIDEAKTGEKRKVNEANGKNEETTEAEDKTGSKVDAKPPPKKQKTDNDGTEREDAAQKGERESVESEEITDKTSLPLA
ncbi:hypothetical protein HDK77DRAFT_430113 [Phyllosticta capitalensis]